MRRLEYMGSFNGLKSLIKLFEMLSCHVWGGMGGSWVKFWEEQSRFKEIEILVGDFTWLLWRLVLVLLLLFSDFDMISSCSGWWSSFCKAYKLHFEQRVGSTVLQVSSRAWKMKGITLYIFLRKCILSFQFPIYINKFQQKQYE